MQSPDVGDLRAFAPPNDAFAVLVQLIVGPSDGPGEESFDVLVCSPAWLADQTGPIIGRHHLIVQGFSYDEVERVVLSYLQRCEGDEWKDVAEKVGRLGLWEFEDYRP